MEKVRRLRKGTPVDSPPSNILVINLMRLGDLVQSRPVLRGLRAQYPEASIGLAVLDVFQEGAALLRSEVDRIVAFPSLPLTTALEQQGWPAAGRLLARWLKEAIKPRPQLAINLTPTLLAGLLARLSGAPHIRGLTVSRRREVVTWPAWASYALVASKVRQTNPFNVTDLFAKVAGLAPQGGGPAAMLPPEPQDVIARRQARLGLPAHTLLIGLLPGASQPERQWPPLHFAQVATRLAQELRCHFLIFGSARERALGEAIQRQLPPGAATLTAGETGTQDLAGWLAGLDLLITNDTGPMHLAAALGRPVLGIFLATARVWDTGPAGAGHVMVQPLTSCHPCPRPCTLRRCHQDLSPSVVAALAREMLTRGKLPGRGESPGWERTQAYLSVLDPAGWQQAVPLVRRPLTREDLWRWTHRLLWEELLEEPAPTDALKPWLANVVQEYYLPPSDSLGLAASWEALAAVERLALQGAGQAEEIGRLACAAGRSPRARSLILAHLVEINAIDQELRRRSVEFPEVAALVEFFFLDQRVREDQDFLSLASDLRCAYQLLARAGRLCRQSAAWLARQAGIDGNRPEAARREASRWHKTTNIRADTARTEVKRCSSP